MNPTAETLKRIAAELRALFPEVQTVIALNAWSDGRVTIDLHGCGAHDRATALFQKHGLNKRRKTIQAARNPWFTFHAEVDGVDFTGYCEGLPPSCRLVTEMVCIPKQQTVDSGEFIEVPKLRVVCDNGTAELAALAL